MGPLRCAADGSIRLDLACGQRCRPGFTGVDFTTGTQASVIHDLRVTPWPWADASVSETHCQHFLEHLDGPERMAFMEELWRILIMGAKATFITPYWSSARAIQDPTHKFPPISEQSYLYFCKQWRVENKIDHYPIHCNFTFEYSHILDPKLKFASEAAQERAMGHSLNVVDDLVCILTKQPA